MMCGMVLVFQLPWKIMSSCCVQLLGCSASGMSSPSSNLSLECSASEALQEPNTQLVEHVAFNYVVMGLIPIDDINML